MLTEELIHKSIMFFHNNELTVLENQSRKINKKQPSFTAMIYAFEMHGYTRNITEEILESIFVIYYAYTELLKIDIDTISTGQIAKNQKLFMDFIDLYNKERKHEDKLDFKKIDFIKSNVVLNYALQKLLSVFNDIDNFPNEIITPYFALLKAIEYGANKKVKS